MLKIFTVKPTKFEILRPEFCQNYSDFYNVDKGGKIIVVGK